MPNPLFKTKPLSSILDEAASGQNRLKRSLRAIDLIAIGIGCIIGVGIFVLPGTEAAHHSGPGIIISFVIAALACAFTALSYAELASMIPVSGSAYSYTYATLGEAIAWIVGWDLILEYVLAAIFVSIGWSAYFSSILQQIGLPIPKPLCGGPFGDTPGLINLPALLIVALLTFLLVRGTKESARINMAIVVIKVLVIAGFILAAARHVVPSNWTPFMPFGFSGVLTSAGVVFLAFAGFDAVSTTAEEAVNPQRDVPIGILGSLLIATVLYVGVAVVMTGIVPYKELGVANPMNLVLDRINMPVTSIFISLGAISGITSVLLVLLMGQPRIFFSMSRDGLLPSYLSRVHPRFGTPHITTVMTGVVIAILASFARLDVIAELCSLGTLLAYNIVSIGVIILRYTRKDLKRTFKVPFFPVTPILAILLCSYLMISLPLMTWVWLFIWLILGVLIYAFYGFRHSRLR
ncbi:MAG: amino acid permease [Oligoflexales bacterium]|nr:amino acid permease [Oligoflexales bacterium]